MEVNHNESENLPDEVELFPFQVAGHKHGSGRLGLGILKHKSGLILKPLFKGDARSVAELSFYENAFQHAHSDPLVKELASFLPGFCGTRTMNISGKDIKYLCLEDVSGTFQNPSILDVKIGPITYEANASEGKVLEQEAKFLHGAACGIRIVGMKVYDDEKQLHVSQDRMLLRQLDPDTIEPVLSLYFSKDRFVNCLMLCGFLHKLLQLDCWFSRQRKFQFIASSILFAYEGTLSLWRAWIENKGFQSCINNTSNPAEENESPSILNHLSANHSKSEMCVLCGLDKSLCSEVLTDCNLFRIVMIDFAHCSASDKEDTNYIIGLHKLIEHMKSLLKKQLENC